MLFDRSYFSTLAYSYAIEKYWKHELYESTLDLLLDMITHQTLPTPHFLVVLEAPATIRQRRCELRDSPMKASTVLMAYRELHASKVFSSALSEFYCILPDRVSHLFPTTRIECVQSPIEVAARIQSALLEPWCNHSDPPINALRDALSCPSGWSYQAATAFSEPRWHRQKHVSMCPRCKTRNLSKRPND